MSGNTQLKLTGKCKISHRSGVLCIELIPLELGVGEDKIQLSYHTAQRRRVDRLQITASTFDQLGQQASSPDYRAYCRAELTVFFPDNSCVTLGGWKAGQWSHT